MRFLVVAALLAVGCGGVPGEEPGPVEQVQSPPLERVIPLTGWGDAMARAWGFYFERRPGLRVQVPAFELVSGAALDCVDSNGIPGFTISSGCKQGAFYAVRDGQARIVRLADPGHIGGGETYMVAHELWHAALYDSTGDQDDQHKNEGWGGIVFQAAAVLDAAR